MRSMSLVLLGPRGHVAHHPQRRLQATGRRGRLRLWPRDRLRHHGPMIRKAGFLIAYVDDFQAAYRFYADILGLVPAAEFGPQARFFAIGEDQWGLFLEGGHLRLEKSERHAQ